VNQRAVAISGSWRLGSATGFSLGRRLTFEHEVSFRVLAKSACFHPPAPEVDIVYKTAWTIRSGCRSEERSACGHASSAVETVEGDGFVAVRKVDAPRSRKGKPASSQDGQRRLGRPRKQR
jgi:hypothetical protein